MRRCVFGRVNGADTLVDTGSVHVHDVGRPGKRVADHIEQRAVHQRQRDSVLDARHGNSTCDAAFNDDAARRRGVPAAA